jgi:lysyl-tRNA synthetase class 1
MDGIPVYLDRAVYEPYLGMPLYTIPSPDGKAKNFAEYFAQEFIRGYCRRRIYSGVLSSKRIRIKSGKFNDAIRMAIENAIRHSHHLQRCFRIR